jgi:adenosylmethionine-8-amino-7-oxononanoate aminotransferase
MVQVRKTSMLICSFPNTTLGSEASEAAIKMVTQYFGKEKSPTEPDRSLFIARECSYHGATLGALNLSGFKARKALYHAILPDNMHTVPACHPYRNQQPGQTDLEYVEWHRDKLVEKIKELGSNKVAGFIVEPIVGAVSAFTPSYYSHKTTNLRTACMFQGRRTQTYTILGPWLCPRGTWLSQSHERGLRRLWYSAHL